MTSDAMKRGLDAVRKAEKVISGLIENAARQGRYAEASALAALAEQVAMTRRGVAEAANSGMTSFAGDDAGASPQVPSAQAYPMFRREGDFLVKVGWSKTKSTTYEHKAPYDVLERVVDRIARISAGDQPFSAEALSDLAAQKGDSDRIPGYQLYLCLGWLKRNRIVRRHGRSGYTVRELSTLSDDVQSAWKGLPDLSFPESHGG